MPTYSFRDPKTGKEWTDIVTIAEMEAMEASGIEIIPGAPYLGDAVRQGMKKPSEGFRDILRHIKRKHKGGKRIDATAGINTF